MAITRKVDVDNLPRPHPTPLNHALRNPLMAMPVWIVLALAAFPLGWSYLYRELSADTLFFLLGTAGVFGALALLLRPGLDPRQCPPPSRLLITTITVYFMFAYVANGGVPIVQLSLNQQYDIYGFGLPLMHVAVLSFTGYYGVRCFRASLDQFSWTNKHFIAFAWIAVLLISIANRSAVSFLFFACAVVYFRSRRLRISGTLSLILITSGLLYAFGLLGDLRLGYQVQQITAQAPAGDEIMRLTQATDAFLATGLPGSLLWAFNYVVSPIGNLNSAISLAGTAPCGPDCDLLGLAVYELVPDVFSQHIGAALEIRPFDKTSFLVSSSFTASTTFGSAFGYAGLVGALIVACWLAVLSVGMLASLQHSPYREEGLALLATLLFFSFFENMWAYAPLSLQLLYPVLPTIFKRSTHTPHQRRVIRK